MHYRTALLILCLVSGFGAAHAQKMERGQKSDAAAKPAAPTIEATQQYITELLTNPEKSKGRTLSNTRTLRDADGRRGYTDWEVAYHKLTFEGVCRATYIDKSVTERTYPNGNGYKKTKTIRQFDLDLSRLKLQYEPNSNGSAFSYPVLSSKKEIEDIPFVYSESTEGERKNAKGDMVDESKPDVDSASKARSVQVPVEFLGVYAEKSKKAFEHLLNECAKRSGEPKELF